jgi:O-antigen ligase
MTALSTTARFDRAFFTALADWLAVGVALALPWSTTATGIFIAAWLVVVLPTLDAAAIKRELVTAAGGLPVLLCCLGAIGMLWADVDWAARLGGLDSFIRLLLIPLLLAQFRRSAHGGWVIYGFLLSVTVLLVVSFILVLTPGLTWRGHVVAGVPVHDDIFQDSEFLVCGFGLLGYVALEGKRLHWRAASVFLAMGAFFFANFAFVVISRISVAVAPALAVLLGWRICRGKGVLVAAILAVVIGAVALFASPSLRERMNQSIEEIQTYRATDAATSIGMHAAFLKESVAIIASAPIIGHGTGSIPEQFRHITAGQSGAAAVVSVNPHNQTFGVAIQLGILGAIALWAMWIAHLLLFRGEGVAAWLGTVVVVENIGSSIAHSHLFDFTHGWLYVFAVGVLGGMVLQERGAPVAKQALL